MGKIEKCTISNQQNRPIVVRGQTIPPYGSAVDVSPSMVGYLQNLYGADNILVMSGKAPKLKPKGVELPDILPPPADEALLKKEEEIIGAMRKIFVTGRFKGLTHVDIAGIVLGNGDRLVDELEDCTHMMTGDRPAKSALDYGEEHKIPMLELDVNNVIREA